MYKVKLEAFEGPLDLLLFLIKKDQIDIYNIPIAKITEEYLKYLELMELLDLDIAGEFLVMAATLMYIKSKMLLPPDETKIDAEEEADPRAELVQRLLEYKAFKEVTEKMRDMEARQLDLFYPTPDRDGFDSEFKGERFFEASLFDLMSAFSAVLQKVPKESFLEVIKEQVTVERKIHDMLHLLVKREFLPLRQLFEEAKSKIEMIVIFLAVLELIKMRSVIAVQKELFGEIEIIRNPKAIAPVSN